MRWLALFLALAGAASAQTAQEIARTAADQLERAAERLEAAQGASDRVAALSATVRAYEEGLAALRDGLRQIAVQRRALEDDLALRDAEIARLIAALQGMEQAASPLLLLHPSGPLGTAQAAMVLAEVTPALQRQADALRDDLAQLNGLEALERATADSLEAGLAGIQDARAVLSDAIADRAPLPEAVAADAARLAELQSQVASLDAFAEQLGALPALLGSEPITRPLAYPADGVLLRGFQEADAAGIARPGLVLATYDGALVSAPIAGTVRYAGPLLDYGNVIILEPDPETLMVFAGLSVIYAQHNAILEAQDPLGVMGGMTPNTSDFLRQPRAGGSATRSETLYIEVREAGRPVDPATWFADE